METEVIHEFTSHIGGRNAAVQIYKDRVEWSVKKQLSRAKLTTGVMTAGLSLFATGANKNGSGGQEMMPIKSISSVIVKRDGMLNSKVVLTASGNTIEMRVSHAEAETVKSTITRLMLG